MQRATGWSAAAIFVIAVPLMGQFVGVKAAKEPPAVPVSKPEPRRRLQSDPLTIFQNVLSTSKDNRRRAYQDLGWSKDALDPAAQPGDARLSAVRLDTGSDLEYVLIMNVWPPGTVAYVFAKNDQCWWEVGKFHYSWHWNSGQADRFIELREVVSYGRKDIIVREQGGGTGVSETRLSIYRMHEGRLYQIFQAIEDAFHYVLGGGETVYEERKIEYPDSDPARGKFLVVRYHKRTELDKASGRDQTRETHSCSAHRWDAEHFAFVKDGSATARLCAGYEK